MRMLLIRNLALATVLITTTGCSAYYESKAEDMAKRQMDAMVFVKGGEFMMGNPGGWDGSKDSWPPHKVILDDFYIQKYEITQGDFELFQSATGYESSDKQYEERRAKNPNRYAPKLPAVASWTDSAAFCQWLGEQSGKNVGLPTEAQWEYAARARGKMLRYATENGEAKAGVTMAAGPDRNAHDMGEYNQKLPKPPGSFPPNPIGLYDMSGNAGEWVHDYYQPDYYQHSSIENPDGPKSGRESILGDQQERVRRGGNYKDFIFNTTVVRGSNPENDALGRTAFRCAAKSSSHK